MIVLDTNMISELFRSTPDRRVVAWIKSLPEDVATTTITLAELLAGVRRLPTGRRKNQLEAALGVALKPYRGTNSLLAFDDEAAGEYAEVLFAREKAGLSADRESLGSVKRLGVVDQGQRWLPLLRQTVCGTTRRGKVPIIEIVDIVVRCYS